jgi:hypothetical protein
MEAGLARLARQPGKRDEFQPRSQALCSWEAKTLVGAGHVTPQILRAKLN